MYDHILESPVWWRGLTLAQRAEGRVSVDGEQLDNGRRRRDAWRGGHIVRGRDISLDRWERLGLSEERLVELLAESTESLAARFPDRPPWMDVVADAWQRFGAVGSTVSAPDGPSTEGPQGREDDHESPPEKVRHDAYLTWIAPLLAWTHDELTVRLTELAARQGDDRLPGGHPLSAPPMAQLRQMIISVLVLEVNVARMEGRLVGATPTERMASFVEQLREPSAALALLAEYPVLARELVHCVQTTVRVRLEFAAQFLEDLPAIRKTFGGAWQGLADLADVDFGRGDTHRGGHSVAILTFTDGRKLVYKPRSLRTEVHFNEVLRWLNTKGLRHPLRTLRVLDRPGHGWVEHVTVEPCQDDEQVTRFFHRQGSYLALFYALSGSDMHLENVIAAGEHPVVVDLEALFQVLPRCADDTTSPLAAGTAPRVVRDSVLRIGLLPERVIALNEDGVHDIEVSGLAGGGGQLSPLRTPTYADSGTDQVRVVRDRRKMPDTDNRATLAGQPVNALAYTDALTAGFEDCYRLLLAHRDDLLGTQGLIAMFRDDEVRFIPRPTMTYARLQYESWHPDLLRDALDREIFTEALASGFADLPDRDLLLASEQRQLAAQDIPSFHTTPGSSDLQDGYGLVAANFLAESGLAAVRKRLGEFGERDLRSQLWCIRASMSGLTAGALRAQSVQPSPLPDSPLDEELAVRAARSVADLLLETALAGEGETPSWLSLNFVGDRYWRVGHAGLDLYSGVTGIALFLAQLGVVTGEARFRRPAEQIARQLVDATEQLATSADHQAVWSIGGFSELGGLVYVLSQLAGLWDEPALLDAAQQAAAMCRARFAEDNTLDVIGGTAGAALSILALHRARPDDWTLDTLRAAGVTLEDRAVRVPGGIGWRTEFEAGQALLGFAHGASGITYALASIAEVTGESRLNDLCGQALGFERHHLSRERGNWPNLRTDSGPDAYMDAWCHGAGGIGLARAALLRLPGIAPWHDLVRTDLDLALGTARDDLIVADRFVGIGNDSICHGDLGLVETVLTAGSVLGDPELTLVGRRAARVIAEQVVGGGPRPGVPQGITTPGLLMGLAGIGYGLLRAVLPERIPNVLLLDSSGSDDRPGGAGGHRIAAAVPVPAG
ncbi:type 2 lanthipeptide synthetase LanM family protein [Micromonospora sp. NPDC049230]|uniref:type 2 lanthipeptide synthetase LanM family protein n=1 Tax=Micromonospora sp. NPDC049230 TaxID=3155502 RepID=UPI0033D5C8DD